MSHKITITLPYPLSANKLWRTYMPKGFKAPVTVVSSEGKEYKRTVAWLCKAAGIKEPIAGRVHVDIKLYPKRPQDYAKRMAKNPDSWDDDVQCIDLDNARKVLYDALKGIAFDDDKWIFSDSGKRMEPDGDARVVVTITRIVTTSAQDSLFEVAA